MLNKKYIDTKENNFFTDITFFVVLCSCVCIMFAHAIFKYINIEKANTKQNNMSCSYAKSVTRDGVLKIKMYCVDR